MQRDGAHGPALLGTPQVVLRGPKTPPPQELPPSAKTNKFLTRSMRPEK